MKDVKEDWSAHNATNNSTHNGTHNASHPANSSDVAEDNHSSKVLQAIFHEIGEDHNTTVWWNHAMKDASEDHK